MSDFDALNKIKTEANKDQKIALAMLVHLSQRAKELIDSPFKDGFETAIEEAAEYVYQGEKIFNDGD